MHPQLLARRLDLYKSDIMSGLPPDPPGCAAMMGSVMAGLRGTFAAHALRAASLRTPGGFPLSRPRQRIRLARARAVNANSNHKKCRSTWIDIGDAADIDIDSCANYCAGFPHGHGGCAASLLIMRTTGRWEIAWEIAVPRPPFIFKGFCQKW